MQGQACAVTRTVRAIAAGEGTAGPPGPGCAGEPRQGSAAPPGAARGGAGGGRASLRVGPGMEVTHSKPSLPHSLSLSVFFPLVFNPAWLRNVTAGEKKKALEESKKKKKRGWGDSEAKAPSGGCICARETICMCVEMPEFVSSWVGGGGRGRNAGNQVGLRGEGLRQSLHPVVA